MTDTEGGSRLLHSSYYGDRDLLAREIRLLDGERRPGTAGWLSRFQIVCVGEFAEVWPTVNAQYVDGVLNSDGDWQAAFPEPTVGNPTRFVD